MKKWAVLLLTLTCVFGLAGCEKGYDITFTVPAGSAGEFIFSDEEISATGKKITISSDRELGAAEVILEPVNDMITPGYVATAVTPGCPAVFDATGGEWFRIGLSVRNETGADKTVYITVRNVDVRVG